MKERERRWWGERRKRKGKKERDGKLRPIVIFKIRRLCSEVGAFAAAAMHNACCEKIDAVCDIAILLCARASLTCQRSVILAAFMTAVVGTFYRRRTPNATAFRCSLFSSSSVVAALDVEFSNKSRCVDSAGYSLSQTDAHEAPLSSAL